MGEIINPVRDSSSILFDLVLKNLDSHLSFFEYRMMSSGCEDSSVNTMGIRGIPEQCGCGRRTGIYTSKTKVNPGRTFFHYKKTAKILREKIVGISSEYRYSDDVPTKQVVGNNSSEFLLSSEIPRNFPTEFRGNKFPRKFRGPLFCRKCPRNIPRENFVGIFPRTFIDRCVFGHIYIDR